MNTWILVVARDGAKLYEQSGRRAPLKKINEYSNPDGRKQDRELRSDKPGRSMRSGSPSRHALSPHKQPREQELGIFLKSLAQMLDGDAQHKRFDEISIDEIRIVAGPHVLGMLKEQLSDRVSAKFGTAVVKDLFHASDEEMSGHL